MDAALYTLLGVVVGAGASFAGTYFQQRQQNRRDRLRIAADLGMQDFKEDLTLARARPIGGLVAPLESYVIYHAKMLDAIEAGDVTPATIQH